MSNDCHGYCTSYCLHSVQHRIAEQDKSLLPDVPLKLFQVSDTKRMYHIEIPKKKQVASWNSMRLILTSRLINVTKDSAIEPILIQSLTSTKT